MSAPLVVVQARMGSSRLPGKVLMDLAGRPQLVFMLERLAPLADAGATVVVATSDLDRDDPVAEVAAEAGAAVVRAEEADVLARMATALDRHPAELVVRLTADCPLVDPAIVDAVLARAEATGADYASTTLVRTFPDGLDVEVVRADALRRAAAEAVDPDEREHVTPHLVRHPRRHALAQVTSGIDAGHHRWTVDTAEDLDAVRAAVAALPDPATAPWRAVLAALEATGAPPVRTPHPGPVAAVPGPDVAHERGQPYRRRWHLHEAAGATALGAATVTVDEAVGHLAVDLAPDAPATVDDVADAVRWWLAQDLQTTDLIVPATQEHP